MTDMRRPRVVALVIVVALMHGLLMDRVAEGVRELEESIEQPAVERIDVSFVRELKQAEPEPAPRRAPPAPQGSAAAAVAKVAQASKPAASAPEAEPAVPLAAAPASSPTTALTAAMSAALDSPVPPAFDAVVTAQAPTPTPTTPAPSPSPVDLALNEARLRAEAAARSAAGGGALSYGDLLPGDSGEGTFDWPPSTRLSYALTGNYQGPIEGTAHVQWVRQRGRYQVQMDVYVGPEFAPLMWRRMTSDGVLSDRGLRPRHYDEETRVAFSRRRTAIRFEDNRIVLGNGAERPLPKGVQDSASQFVQMSFIFTLDPTMLKPGTVITLPVALPRRVDNWIYDVMTEETLFTSVGPIKAFHVKPRRESPRPGELTAQAWFAPSLQYLPVRILIHQDADTYVDLLLSKPPMQAAPGS